MDYKDMKRDVQARFKKMKKENPVKIGYPVVRCPRCGKESAHDLKGVRGGEVICPYCLHKWVITVR